MHEESFVDDERAKHLLNMYKTDFNLEGEVKNFRTCLRPQSHDDLPIVGAMSYFPNVVLNLGHGGHGTSISLACAKMVEEMIEGGTTIPKTTVKACSSNRCFI